MAKTGTVYWAELQAGLSDAGLNVSVGIPRQGGLWSGTIDDKPFMMTILAKDEVDGLRDFMLITLCGQDEKEVALKLSVFMGYQPFCRYQRKGAPAPITVTLEWDRRDPAGRFEELSKEEHVFNLEKIEAGFSVSAELDMSRFYQEVTPEAIQVWEGWLNSGEQTEWNGQSIKLLLPFIKKVMPRIGKIQSLFGMSLISLDGRHAQEKEIVEYGLQPLVKAEVISAAEAENILAWYQRTEPSWDSGGYSGRFEKRFRVNGIGYRIWTDAYRNCRDLNLVVSQIL